MWVSVFAVECELEVIDALCAFSMSGILVHAEVGDDVVKRTVVFRRGRDLQSRNNKGEQILAVSLLAANHIVKTHLMKSQMLNLLAELVLRLRPFQTSRHSQLIETIVRDCRIGF